MYTTRFIRLKYLVPNTVYTIFIPMVSSLLVYILYVVLGYHNIAIPLLPVTLIGTAVSFTWALKTTPLMIACGKPGASGAVLPTPAECGDLWYCNW